MKEKGDQPILIGFLLADMDQVALIGLLPDQYRQPVATHQLLWLPDGPYQVGGAALTRLQLPAAQFIIPHRWPPVQPACDPADLGDGQFGAVIARRLVAYRG